MDAVEGDSLRVMLPDSPQVMLSWVMAGRRDAEDDGAGNNRMVPEIMVPETMAPNTTICIHAGSAVSKSWMQTNGCGASGVQRMEYNWGCLCGAGHAEMECANECTGK